jgi:hypothetical protein
VAQQAHAADRLRRQNRANFGECGCAAAAADAQALGSLYQCLLLSLIGQPITPAEHALSQATDEVCMPRLTPFRLASGIFLIGSLCLFGWWGWSALFAQPKVYLPIPGAYIAPNQQTCGSGGCYYVAYYQSPTPAQEAAIALQRNGWDCHEILSEADPNRNRLIPLPYWRCRGKAFPTGWATIEIEPISQTETLLHLWVSWS